MREHTLKKDIEKLSSDRFDLVHSFMFQLGAIERRVRKLEVFCGIAAVCMMTLSVLMFVLVWVK